MSIIVPGLFRTAFNCPSIAKPKFDDYTSFHDVAPLYLKKRQTNPDAADPEKGMDVVMDVVRGEGRAAGLKTEWPLWLVLGDDALADIEERLGKMEKMLHVWGDVGRNLSA